MEKLYLENSPIAYYIDGSAGNKDWVVFLHAAFVDSRMFNKQFDYFAGKYNLIAVDIIGHGQSVKAHGKDGIEDMSRWIDGILTKHGINAAHFVGVSLGSVIAQDFCNRFDKKVLSLACFGGYDINDFDIKAQKSNTKQQMSMMLKALFSIKQFARSNKKISAYTESAQEEFYNLNIQFPKKSFMYLAKLGNLVNKYPSKMPDYPLLVGCGEHDIPMELEVSRIWAERANCQYAVVAGAGHCVNMDKPDEFNLLLEQFWQNGNQIRQ